jgi:hypothetical protein
VVYSKNIDRTKGKHKIKLKVIFDAEQTEETAQQSKHEI